MSDPLPLAWAIGAVALSIAVLLLLILRFKLPAFFSLVIVSALCGLLLGMDPQLVIAAIRDGMGGTLGFIAVVVGLGAMLGALLEHAGGVKSISNALLAATGIRNAPWALSIVGFLIAIPVFFDVGFILLAPLIYGLAKETSKSRVYFALPLLAGLAATHAFMPPTPGPIAVAELLKADLGWVIIFGAIAGLPAALIGGPIFASLAFSKTKMGLVAVKSDHELPSDNPSALQLPVRAALMSIFIPLILIIAATISNALGLAGPIFNIVQFIGHPFAALTIALGYLYLRLRVTKLSTPELLNRVMAKSLEPAAAVILVTGAGGAFKQVLIESGVGAQIAEAAASASLAPLVFGFVCAAIIRVMQGSATVAMITGAGLAAPFVETAALSAPQTALVVIAVASGATLLSHVNDSGFWLVSRYLNLSAGETLRSWTISSTLVGGVGFLMTLLLSMII